MATRPFKFLVVVLLFALFLFQNIRLAENYHAKYGMTGVIWSDAYTYYQYLPAVFLGDDALTHRSAIPLESGLMLSKVTYGVALMETPFFYANYRLQQWKGNPGNGMEHSYGYAMLIAASTYVFLGLWMIFSLLRKWFNPFTAIICMLGIYYGTNLMHYTYAEPGTAHAFSFFCASGLLFFTDRFYQNPRFGWTFVAVTVFMALIVLIRPVNLIMVLIFALYNCYSWADFKARFRFLFSKIWLIPGFMIVGFIFFFPQLYYWHAMTGHWFVSPYTMNDERFIYLSNPKIAEALFSHQGGWFPYSQIMLISMAALPFMIYKRKFHGWLILIVFAIILYICSSWWAINFMCAHGYRSFIDYSAIFIIPFAWLFYTITTKAPRWASTLYTVAVLMLIYFACCMNIDFSIVNACINKDWLFYDYIKLYDNYI